MVPRPRARFDLLPPLPSLLGLDVSEGQPHAINASGTALVVAGCEKSAEGSYAVVADQSGVHRHLHKSKVPLVKRWGGIAFLCDDTFMALGGVGLRSPFSHLQCARLEADGAEGHSTSLHRRCVGDVTPPTTRRSGFSTTILGDVAVQYGGAFVGGADFYEDLTLLPFECTSGRSMAEFRDVVAVGAETTSPCTPGKRADHTLTRVCHEAMEQRHACVLFGGRRVVEHEGGFRTQSCLGDTWLLDVDVTRRAASWTLVTCAESPCARFGHSAAQVQNGDVMLYGGFDGLHVLSDLWCFSGSNLSDTAVSSHWRRISIFNGVQRPLTGHVCFYFPQLHVLLVGVGRCQGFHEASSAVALDAKLYWLSLPGCSLKAAAATWVCSQLSLSDPVVSRFATVAPVQRLLVVLQLLRAPHS